MVRIKTCRLTRNPQLGDPVAWLNLTLADGRELDDVALHRSPGGRWFFQGWGWLSAELAAVLGQIHLNGSLMTLRWRGARFEPLVPVGRKRRLS
jgi:hypothetical protein